MSRTVRPPRTPGNSKRISPSTVDSTGAVMISPSGMLIRPSAASHFLPSTEKERSVPSPVTRTVLDPSRRDAHRFHRPLSAGQSRKQASKNIPETVSSSMPAACAKAALGTRTRHQRVFSHRRAEILPMAFWFRESLSAGMSSCRCGSDAPRRPM